MPVKKVLTDREKKKIQKQLVDKPITEEDIYNDQKQKKWSLEDIQQVADEMRNNNPISELEEKIKTELFRNNKEERIIAMNENLPWHDINQKCKELVSRGIPLEGSEQISEDNYTQANGLCKIFSNPSQ